METNISPIPFRKLVEVPFYVQATASCFKYVDIQLFISSTCENSNTYQYGVTLDKITGNVAVDYDTTYGMSSSSATFSVSWGSSLNVAASMTNDSTAQNASNNIPFWAIAIIALLVILIVLIFVGVRKLFRISDYMTSQTPKVTPLHEVYQQKSNEFEEINEHFVTTEMFTPRPVYTRSNKLPTSHTNCPVKESNEQNSEDHYKLQL